MPIIKHSDAPIFDAPDVRFTGYAAPSRGARQLSTCCVELAAGSESPLHRLDCEEVFLGLEGRVVATVDGSESAVGAGDCLIVPAETPFTFRVDDGQPFRALVCMPAGGRATMIADGTTIDPPWAV
jgi:mannose-6-phosphate isomerase-like protein (cupin superfamily)